MRRMTMNVVSIMLWPPDRSSAWELSLTATVTFIVE